MKKATKVFICLSLIVLLIFFTVKIFEDELAEPLYNYGLISDSAYCDLRGGEMVSNEDYYSPPTIVCRIKAKDHMRICRDNIDCEGTCKIKNLKILREKRIITFGKEISNISLREFEEKTKERIEGYCSKFIFDTEKCSNNSNIYVEEGMIKFYTEPWGSFCEGFKPY